MEKSTLSYECPGCGNHVIKGILTVRLVRSHCTEAEIKNKFYPAHNVMVRQSCPHCGKFHKWIPQTEENIEILNEQQDGMIETLTEMICERIG